GGNYSLVYTGQLENSNVAMVFAPNKGSRDIGQYLYLQYDLSGKEICRSSFKSPASALLISDMTENDGSVYFIGNSGKSDKAYEEVFSEYAPIYNPGSTTGGENRIDFKWQKSSEGTMENVHLLKFSGKDFTLATTTPTDEFKKK